MLRRALLLMSAMLCVASAAFAQYRVERAPTTAPATRVEIIPMGGYAWTMSQDVYLGVSPGELDFDDNAYYGVALDFNLQRPGYKTAQLRVMWRREDSDVIFRPALAGQPLKANGSIEYWQIGGVGGIHRGNAMPFTSITLGGSRLVGDNGDNWKFSMIFGLGVKVYTQGKIGFMIQANFPITFTDTWGGVSVGTGGAGLAIGGTGIGQIDVGGGLIISL